MHRQRRPRLPRRVGSVTFGRWSIIFRIEIEQEEDGRWLAEVTELSGVMAYGTTSEKAVARVQALTLRVLGERLELGEAG